MRIFPFYLVVLSANFAWLPQVEFYFGDSNLPRDKFLREAVEQSDDGLVSLALVCSFSRMKSHLGLDTALKPETVPVDTVLAVAAVLRCSSLLRVSEDGLERSMGSEVDTSIPPIMFRIKPRRSRLLHEVKCYV
ncbi:hypothetical protein BRADI_3g48441v3 [Brachypodium distachyon]|uniref:HTH La-type RNA-binding domain-containing protein n=1 Tax=Brachypodium distachyon TaxID=15368 RepID=A0A0Q3QEM2_BRADI|nr:hypothetical protein BRADI_3g48441v3 [Brachypodium distachyon]